jgi:ATP-dependent DNA helicase RecG
VEYIAYGKPNLYGRKISIPHPEMEPVTAAAEQRAYLQPVYHTTEKLKIRFLESKYLSKLIFQLLEISLPHLEENLPDYILKKFKFIRRNQAIYHIHFPKDETWLHAAKRRLKFEELFYVQLKILFISGKQMNRLLQGDVGSGKTIVGFVAMLMAVENGTQACIMAPTEILAQQHYHSLKPLADSVGLTIGLLTGSTKKSERKILHEKLQSGELNILAGTHALLEEEVKFKQLGLCVIDEQHRFGVAQRAKLWSKNAIIVPHVLVMTATPIPRTLAMTLYGDLDVSVIDELPPGRKPVKTLHQYDTNRLKLFGFIKEQIEAGRQVYIVYPLIEESEKMEYKDLMDGYESVSRAFPGVPLSILHGRMKSEDKNYEIGRFQKNETKIMVATTVIEVGVNIPNASVMVIENAEKFGLSQLHQLRGRVGRGADQSYCILMSGVKLSKEARTRIDTMVKTNNGFEIADVDLKLRGPGDLAGTRQSGVLDLLIADLAQDGEIVKAAREYAMEILEKDQYLNLPEHTMIKKQVESFRTTDSNWSRIS